MSSLLEKAKSVKVDRKVSKIPNGMSYSEDQVLELVEAWLKEEISLTQFSIAIGANSKKSGNVLYAIAAIIKVHYKLGNIKINYKK